MVAVKIPRSYLILSVLGAGIPIGTHGSDFTIDEKVAGFVTPPWGRITVGEVTCCISDTKEATNLEKPRA
jgi:hypothetical protein